MKQKESNKRQPFVSYIPFFLATNGNQWLQLLQTSMVVVEEHIRLCLAREDSNVFGYTDTLTPQLTCRSSICVAAAWKGSVTPNIRVAGWEPMKWAGPGWVSASFWEIEPFANRRNKKQKSIQKLKPLQLQTLGGATEKGVSLQPGQGCEKWCFELQNWVHGQGSANTHNSVNFIKL